MKKAIFWGSPKNFYKAKPFIVDPEHEEKAMATIIENYISGYEKSPEYVLGVWDPFLIVEDESVENLDINIAYDDSKNFQASMIIPTFLFFTYYSPEKEQFIVNKNIFKEVAKTIDVCTGWGDNHYQNISLRLESGILTPFSSLRRKQQSEFIKRKLICYVIANFFEPGEFWKTIQLKYGISSLIIPSPIHTCIIGDTYMASCDHLQKIPFKKEGPTKIVNYKIDSGLLFGMKEISKNQNRSFTDVFKSALME